MMLGTLVEYLTFDCLCDNGDTGEQGTVSAAAGSIRFQSRRYDTARNYFHAYAEHIWHLIDINDSGSF